MQRSIFDKITEVINAFQGLGNDKQYTILELSRMLKMDIDSVGECLTLIELVQNVCPKIAYSEVTIDQNPLKIFYRDGFSRVFRSLTVEFQLIVYLFLEKVFSPKTIPLSKVIDESDVDHAITTIKMIEESLFLTYEDITNTLHNITYHSYFIGLNEKGMMRAQGILASFNLMMSDYMDNKTNFPIPIDNDIIILPFQKSY